MISKILKIKFENKTNNSSFVNLILAILKFRYFGRSKF